MSKDLLDQMEQAAEEAGLPFPDLSVPTEKCKGQLSNRVETCSRNAVRDGFCTQHHPDSIAKLSAKFREKLNIKLNAEWAKKRLEIRASSPLGKAEKKIAELEAEINQLREAAKHAMDEWQEDWHLERCWIDCKDARSVLLALLGQSK